MLARSLLICACLFIAASAEAQVSRFEFMVRADPAVLPANGVAPATITVTVPYGVGVRDGTLVNFFTTSGRLTATTATILGGQARVQLIAGTQPALAVVTATIGGINLSRAEVEFTNEPVQIRFAPKLLIAHADYLAYNPQRMLIVAKGKCEFKFGNLTILSTNKIEYNLMNEVLHAEGAPGQTGVSIASGTNTIKGDRLVYRLYRHEGQMQSAELGSYLKGIGLVKTEEDPGTLNVREPQYDNGGAWITAREMIIRRNDRIMMRQASFYINEKKQWSLPYHVAQLPGFQPNVGSRVGTPDALGYNSAGGVNLDLPFYYRAEPSGSGALYLRHIGGGGFYSQQPGWSMAVQDEYYVGEQGQGTFVLDRIGRRDWGSTVTHNQEFARGFSGNFLVDSPFHRDVFSQQTLYKELPGYSLTMQSSQSMLSGFGDNYGLQLFGQSNPRALGRSGMTYFLAGSVAGAHFTDPGTSLQRREAASLVLFPQAVRLPLGISMQSSFRAEAGHATGLGAGFGNGATLSLNRSRLLKIFDASLVFSHDQAFRLSAQRSVSGVVSGAVSNRVLMQAFATRNVTDNSLLATGLIGYRLGHKWQLTTETAHFRFGGDRSLDHEISGGYLLGQHELKLTWSQARRRVYFQVGSARF